jgi:hypothetical protein
MVEAITSLEELQKKYQLVTGRRPKKNDLVYVPSQLGVFKVVHVNAMNVKIERVEGSSLFMVLPFSHYKLVEAKTKKK